MAEVYDVVIFGASGFTGKHVVKEALKFVSPDSPIKSIALAGRNSIKLYQTLKWAAPTHPTVPILVADTSDPSSLKRMAAQAKLVLNCVGPYRLHGDSVVEACVEAGCDYLDVCGEPEFMERMESVYHDRAVENGSLVVSACGFDSVPAEFGLMFNTMQWVWPAVPNRVEAYVSLESDKKIVGNYATYESAVLGVANSDGLMKFRKSIRRRARPSIPGYAPPSTGFDIEHQKKIGLWAVKLPSADPSIIRRTLSILTENPSGLQGVNEDSNQAKKRVSFWSKIKPAHFGIKIASKTHIGVRIYILVGSIFGKLSQSPFGRWLLIEFPFIFSLGFFRKTGPTDDEVASASFKMWFVGHGFSDASKVTEEPDKEIITRVTGPEIGYITTPIILVQCALTVLKQRGDLPKGGVYTPGIVFGPTDLYDRLQKNGISFDVVSKGDMIST
ncbi:probable mitochondrial saccharopine dehydrogenase-like oxidoreductase At5g39410 [Rutidosis leptorrhynchoides]|uniref:probable mitochondrial saccharopine dehydrogenase-like oxidoreductase At5g39410 n=1 Tax=Rutidosis leptorrhynchoides TaxID=125765 RepID=UPI003A99A43D